MSQVLAELCEPIVSRRKEGGGASSSSRVSTPAKESPRPDGAPGRALCPSRAASEGRGCCCILCLAAAPLRGVREPCDLPAPDHPAGDAIVHEFPLNWDASCGLSPPSSPFFASPVLRFPFKICMPSPNPFVTTGLLACLHFKKSFAAFSFFFLCAATRCIFLLLFH